MSEQENQRGYFRIDDKVLLRVRKISQDDIVDTNTYFSEFRQSTILTARFHQQRTAMEPVLREINTKDIAVASYFAMLSDQIDLIANRLLSGSIFSPNEPLQEVNMSAEGMSFHSQEVFEVGDQLEMIYALLPDGDYIPVLAEVVRTEPGNDDKAHLVSVRYVNMNANDKELVIHHMLYLQRQYLKQKRLSN